MALILDTCVLLAYLDARQVWHQAVATMMVEQGPPFMTVEPVLSELGFLLRRDGKSQSLAAQLAAEGAVEVVPILDRSARRVAELMQTYAAVPMSLADACLVCLSELQQTVPLATFDRDFLVYRRFRREPVPLSQTPFRVQEQAAMYQA